MAESEQSAMTRTQRRRLEKARKLAARRKARRRKAVRKWSSIALGVAIPLLIIYMLFFHRAYSSNKGILRIGKSEHNFGAVSVREGIKEAKIPLINIGEGDLTITGLDSSCGCTTASVENKGVEGPIFHMAGHGRNPRNWRTVIKPGEQAYLKVYYNPAVHRNVRGAVTRIVTVYSDDPANPKQRVRIKVYQIG